MDESIRIRGGYQDKSRTFKLNKDAFNKINDMDNDSITKKIGDIIVKNRNLDDNKDTIEIKIEPVKPVIQIEFVRKVDKIHKRRENTGKFILYDDLKTVEKFPFKDNYKPNFYNIQNNKIIEIYQKKLKEIKHELKDIIYDYKVIEDQDNNINNTKDADIMLNRLNDLLSKLDKLKSKYNIDRIDWYDDNYIYELINDYIKEFSNKNRVRNIKNSDIYILISEKLDELYSKKDELEEKVNNKKSQLLLDEEDLERLKEKYNEFDRFNIMLLEFQNEQDRILKEMNNKLNDSLDELENIDIKLKAMELQSKKLLNMIGRELFMPIPNVCKKVVTSTVLYMYYIKQMIKPEMDAKMYKTIKINDYSDAIEKNIVSIEDIEKLLDRTELEINKIIDSFKNNYSKYVGKVDSYKSLLSNLEKIRFEIKDRREELNDIKEKQNNKSTNKVKTINIM